MTVCRFASVLVVVGLVGWVKVAVATGEGTGLPTEHLTIGFTETAFLGLSRADVEAGYRALAKAVGERRGYNIVARMQSFQGMEDMDGILAEPSARMLALNSWVFLEMNRDHFTPKFIGAVDGEVGRTYVVITQKGKGLDGLSALRGEEVIVFELANATLGRYWLEVLLGERGLGRRDTYFSGVRYVNRPSLAVLPVFFGKAAAAVVDRSGFDLMVEMNPQVGRELQIVAESEVLVDGVIVLRNDDWPEGSYREDLIRTLGEFHVEPAGAQILTFFKTDRLIPYEENHMDSVRRLKAIYEQIEPESLKP
ncbi:MAG TPA: PhnD/SsuA/transferrin family substrate-binding protein [Kiritimatiellia bacterium]|nr:PhnD/SsuA/transferrin family substrate-binding protein [Kiritimatiellia bacterium]